eukprot:CAMPEP_0206145564 /NCGR_PEP_ID=MMETSP1473-20131121/27760_1 /ASSEMBLY_ACC=CAM_ASM_001109 /TAXON_ID=1461547 /ORGANISM="Stichococcus sp, Strain RCC1054" /LENGTH=65 /DNA_ID=CAMNT_0053541825 /DNA_START=77 /DNA_END=275 /DNA_ORIENTATION=-
MKSAAESIPGGATEEAPDATHPDHVKPENAAGAVAEHTSVRSKEFQNENSAETLGRAAVADMCNH